MKDKGRFFIQLGKTNAIQGEQFLRRYVTEFGELACEYENLG